ncbi:iron chaperone [Streptomyces sp. NPDC087297]|uniref:iron chaperone n=1 Tax=Streptomyces sp. NPDC087297 TaxID=3365778 RepID=UPI0037F3B633
MKGTQTTTRNTGAAEEQADGFTDEERDAIKERAREIRAAGRGRGARAAKPDPEAEVLAKIAEMEDADRVLAERLHAIVKAGAPELSPKLWYGMPAYARAGKVVCFFQSAQKFKTRYATLGFSDPATLDEGTMWPTSYALTTLTPADEALIAELIRKAVR